MVMLQTTILSISSYPSVTYHCFMKVKCVRFNLVKVTELRKHKS